MFKSFTQRLLLICLFFTISYSYAQYPINRIGGRTQAMAGVAVCMQDVWAAYHNQAGLAYLRGINAGIAFQNSFFVKELSTKSISIAIPLKALVLGVNYYNFGYNRFSDNKFGLSFAKRLGKKIALGGQIDYFYTHIDGEYEDKSTAVGELGIIAEPIKNLFIGAHVFNVWNAKFANSEDEYMPSIIKLGASYIIQKKSMLNLELEKDIKDELIVKTAVEIELIDNFVVRAGVAGKPIVYSFGLGYSYKPLKLNIGFSKHHTLGYSPGISIIYALKNRI